MGTSSRRTERVLADAAIKIAKAEDALEMYTTQKNAALEKKKQLEDENEKLRATILSLALQHANVEYRREHVQLRQTLDSYQTKIDQMREISLLNAKVVDRWVPSFICIPVFVFNSARATECIIAFFVVGIACLLFGDCNC